MSGNGDGFSVFGFRLSVNAEKHASDTADRQSFRNSSTDLHSSYDSTRPSSPKTENRKPKTNFVLVSRLACLLLAALGSGCGYRMGHGFEPEIQSVYIPIFQSQADRRGIEFQLTEAVQKEVQNRTPFRIVDEPAADTQLIGRIVNTRKRVLGETRYDDPRELQMSLTVEVRWENLKTGEILAEKRVPITQNEIQLIQRSEFAPEVGQSLATAYQQLVDRMARDIVDMMEAPTL